MTCDHCPEPAFVIAPGADEIRETNWFNLLVKRGTPDRRWCEQCARAAGWPWMEAHAA